MACIINNDDTSIVNKFEASLSDVTDDTRVTIYERHMFIVQATVALPANWSVALLFSVKQLSKT